MGFRDPPHFTPGVEVQQEGTTVDDSAGIINFTGAGASLVDTVAGEVQVDVPGFQSLVRSADGSCWKLTVNNAGAVTTTKVPCPDNNPPDVDAGGILGRQQGPGFTNTASTASVGPAAVTAGKLLVAVCAYGADGTTPPNPTLTDTQGNAWTEITSGWKGSDPDAVAVRVSIWTCVVKANGTTTVTSNLAQNGKEKQTLMTVYEASGHNAANPRGVHGVASRVAHAAAVGETFEFFNETTTGTPAPNSLVFAAFANKGNGFNGLSGDPSSATEDPQFTNVDAYYARYNSKADVGLRVAKCRAGAASSDWTGVHSDQVTANALELTAGVILEIRAA